MTFKFSGNTWLRDGFSFPSLYDYIQDTRQRLMQPLPVPDYATAGESQQIQALSEAFRENPYQQRAAFNEAIRKHNESMTHVSSVAYGEYPMVYDVCVFATRQLMHTTPLIFLYSTTDAGYRYNAFATDFQDKALVYLSRQLFAEHGMLREEELCYIVGHELGHAQCHHSTIAIRADARGSDCEYSADRAGMIVCAKWILHHRPDCTPREAARLAVLYGASALKKLDLAMTSGGKQNWAEFNYDGMLDAIDHVFEGASKLTASLGTHPHSRHRVMAMVHFSQSKLFYRCLGLNPEDYRDLYTDQQLQNTMAYQLTNF